MIGDIEQVLDALNGAGVRYLVVGGVAVVLHGYLRATADLDLVIQLEHENALKGIRALAGLGYRPRAPVPPELFADQAAREGWVREKGLRVFSLWNPGRPALEVDLFVNEPFAFDEVYSRALAVPLERTTATVISLEDLIALKRAAGRPEDHIDIAALEELQAAQRSGDSKEGQDRDETPPE